MELADIPKLVLVAGVASVQKAEKEEKMCMFTIKMSKFANLISLHTTWLSVDYRSFCTVTVFWASGVSGVTTKFSV